jgi:ketosteroid isomerase-like protein
MSQENVERLCRAHDALSRHDLDGLLAVHDPEVEFIPLTLAAESGVPYRGHDGVRSWWRNLHDAFPDFSSAVEEARDLGDVTIARLHLRAHGVESGAPIELTAWQVAEWRDDMVVWWRGFSSEAEALEAAGLSE